MTDYGHELGFGSFLTPSSADPTAVVGLAQLAEQLGLDLVTFQDHPYQPAFLDTWTLLSYVAASTVQIRLAPNVLNLPLRPPAVVARAVAALDRLSGGRVELGLGAGAFSEAVEAMGGPRRTPGESVDALTEAVEIIRALWDTETRGGVRVAGNHYTVSGAKRGPAPAHPVEIWLGAYQPRMLRLTGRVADGWLPSHSYLPPDRLADANAVIDDAAVAAGRTPSDIRRLYNIAGTFGRGTGFLEGPPRAWVEQLAALAVDHGISTFILASDDPTMITIYAREVVPGVHAAVAAARSRPLPEDAEHAADDHDVDDHDVDDHGLDDHGPALEVAAAGTPASDSFGVTPDDGRRLTDPLWDEDARPTGPPRETGRHYSPRDLAAGRQLVDIHDHLRAELAQVRELIGQVLDGSVPAGGARERINEMTMRQNDWTVGAYCAAYCRVVTTHHTIEDRALFPRLRGADPRLAPVVDRLAYEHEIIHEVLERVDAALVAYVGSRSAGGDRLRQAADELSDTLLSHLAYEERELVEPIARLGVLI